MASERDKAKWGWPRFSVRTLLIFAAIAPPLIGAIFGTLGEAVQAGAIFLIFFGGLVFVIPVVGLTIGFAIGAGEQVFQRIIGGKKWASKRKSDRATSNHTPPTDKAKTTSRARY